MNTEVTRADTEFIADIDLIFKLAYYVHRRFSNIVNKKGLFLNFVALIQEECLLIIKNLKYSK